MAETLNTILGAAAELIPRLFGAAVVMLAAFFLARASQRLTDRLSSAIGLDDLAERTGASNSLFRLGYGGGPSRLLGLVVFWAVLLVGVAGALSVLGLSSLEQATNRIVELSGRFLVALVVALAGVMAAGWLANLVTRGAEEAGLRGANGMGRAVFGTVIAVTGLVAAGQLGLDTSVLVLISVILLATIGLVAALALGQGLVPLSGNIAAGRYVQEDLEVGDEISINGIEGTVEQLGYSAVVLRSDDGYLYRIPNRTLLEGIVRKRAE